MGDVGDLKGFGCQYHLVGSHLNIVYALDWISRLEWEIANGGSGYKSEDFFSEEGVSGFLTT